MLFGTRFAVCMIWEWTIVVLISPLDVLHRTRREIEEFWACSLYKYIRGVITGTAPHIKKSVYFREPKSIPYCLQTPTQAYFRPFHTVTIYFSNIKFKYYIVIYAYDAKFVSFLQVFELYFINFSCLEGEAHVPVIVLHYYTTIRTSGDRHKYWNFESGR